MTLPRVLPLGGDGTLQIRPPAELERLRIHSVQREGPRVADGAEIVLEDVRGDCLELALTVEPDSAMQLGVTARCSPDGRDQTVIECDRSAGCLRIDVSRSSPLHVLYEGCHQPGSHGTRGSIQAGPTEKLQLRVILDRSILEVFANDRQCITQRIYPSQEDSLGIRLFSRGGSIEVEQIQAWEMAPTNPW